ncbi:Histone acetyltransferase HAC5 [Hordeum vulgare]|uniref:Predicted protein n=1 Tax=Hordeum vulgare subsp. vulgare TaxID=112509 RepID=F2DJB1_HORVV|nr:BTB/POZ and TAZ domain-containing protein 2-like [Hordeum vulgare subsp. vulgare]KAE8811421.1 Histone acetyltransferase HAC5 [Hordeum vulgare]KAI5014582.1 hypothetical protein ZWY2020_055972 [Hordeum vulgare]BAJ95182.1 predicted protein [Hordeum vulgare subsp. vulgare]BAJ97475.1 predicted protein [Hordeum vulgare subsp. vulgare]
MTSCADFDALRASAADVQIVTSDGQSIAAHSCVLASASPVLERMIDRARRGWGADCTVRVLGVSFDAVRAFLHFLYSAKVAPEEEELVGAHGTQLLALAHAYRVGWLKLAAEAAVSARLTPERAVDMLKLARLCDARRLYLRCARLAAKDFSAVERSDGWRFARRHDAALQLELLRLLEDADQRKERWARERAALEACRQLGEAMASLEHIFPGDGAVCADAPCAKAGCTCRGLQLLMRHFAACAKKAAPGGCARCKRMLQLFRLHASVCHRPDQACRVPLCSHFKAKAQTEKADKTWRLLVKKVTRAKVMSSLAERKVVPEVVAESWARYNGRVAKLR